MIITLTSSPPIKSKNIEAFPAFLYRSGSMNQPLIITLLAFVIYRVCQGTTNSYKDYSIDSVAVDLIINGAYFSRLHLANY